MTPIELAAHPEVREEFQIQFCPNKAQQNCDDARSSAYRTVDGSCNNLDHPEWGAAVTPQPRYQPAQYDDGVYKPMIYLYILVSIYKKNHQFKSRICIVR